MKRFLFVIGTILLLFCWLSPSQAQNSQTVVSGSATTAISFPAGCSYNWVNNTQGIGLAASGSGDIASFIAVNNGTGPIMATIKAAPVGFSYIANQTNPGKVSVYDNASNTLVTTIAVGSNPNAVAASADGSRVYVANTGSKNVSVINTATNAVVATVSVGNLPSGLAVSPDGTRVYVTNNLSSSVSIISTASNSVLAAIPLPANDQPIGIAVSPDGNKLYVADNGPGTVSVIDANTRVKTAVINIGSGSSFPWGITVSPDGSRVYVNDIISNDVTVIDATDNSIITSIPAGGAPNGIAVSPDGSRIYSANGGSVLVIDASTNATITNIAVGTSVVGVSVSPDGSLLYAIDQSNHSFSVINTATNTVITAIPLPVGSNPASFGNFISTGTSCPAQTYTITVYPAVSTITAGPVSGRIAACAGSASVNPAIEQFTVSAFLLTAAITVTAPAGFEVSLAAGSGYANSVSIAQSGGMVNNQVVYVRSATTATGTISGMVSLTSGTTTQSVAVSGAINPLPQVNAIPDKVYNNGDVTTPITFTGGANTFTWTIDNTSIGLPSGGNTSIPSFTAFNNGNAPVVATVTIKPINAAYLYNVNSLDNSISAINTYTSEVTTIPMGLGSSVLSLAVSPDGSKVYVVENGPGKLAVVNTKTNAIDALINVGTAPSGVAVSPDGTRAYVANGLSDNVSVVNTVNNTVIATVNVQSYPYGIAISPDGGRVYVSNLNSGTVSVINTGNNTVITTITVGSGPFGITVSPDGTRLYVADSFAGKVSVINTATNAVINTVTVGSSPYDIAVSPDGSRVYVSNYSSNTISVINAATNGVISTFPGTQRPYSLAVSGDGNWLYIADAATNIISVVNTTTHAIKTTYTVGNGSSTLGNKITSDFGCPGTPVTFKITVNPMPPTITTGPVSGSITACQGSPSAFPAVQQFTVSGNKLTADINITAPAGFEVSLAPSNGYAGSLVLPQSAGTVGAVIVYVRSAASATGNISGNVTLTSTGAVTQNVAVNGIINALPTVATVSDQEVLNGASTTAINFTGTGDIFNWTNDAPGIGLAASGQGNVAAFTAINSGATAVTAHLTVTPSFGADAYIVNQGSGTVSVINTATNSIKTTIPVKTNPLGVAASADGSRVYVVNNGSNSVSVINTSTDAVIATIPVQLFPGGIAVSPDGSRIYVANENSNSVSVINTVTNALVTNVTVGTTPYGIAVNPSGTRVYVTNQGSNSLSVINASNNSVIANITTGMSFPVGVLVSVAGDRVFVTNQNSFNVTVIDANSNTVLAPINAGVQPAGIAQSPDGNLLYVANALSGTVSVLQVATSSLLATYSVGSVPYGISVSPDGNFVYVSNEGSNNVSVINTASGAVVATIALPPGSNPYSFGNFISKGADCSGTPVPFTITVDSTLPVITTTGVITGLSTVYGTASPSTSFQVSGAYLTEGILISPSAGFQVSTDNINFSSSLTIGGAGNVGPVTVYVRIAAGTNVGTYFGNILLTSAGADNVNQPIDNASVNPIPLTITANNVTLFYTPFSGPGSPPQVISGGPGSTAFTETGLLSGETIGSVTMAYGPGSYQGDAINTYPGSVTPSLATGGTFDPDNYHITYVPGDIIIVIPPPAISAGPLSGIIAACIGTASASLNISQFTVSGSYLTGDITVTAPAGFEVSLSAAGGYGNSLVLPQSGGTVNSVLVFVRSAVSGTPGNISGNVILSSAGADDQTVAVLGAVNPSPAADAVVNQVVANGDATTAVTFTGTGNVFTWTNDTPSIGLAANGTGDIASFTAVNTGTAPVIATVTVTPVHRGLAYITNSGDGTVSVVNTATGGIVGTIPVGTAPYGVATSPDGKSMYVTNSASNNVTVINTLTNSVVAIVDVQTGPYGVAVSPDGSRVYVANQVSNSVSVIQTSDNSVIGTINVGANPFAMAVSPDGSALYVTDFNSGQLSIVRTSDNTVTATISVGLNPAGIFVSHDGSTLYIADPQLNIVTVLNTATNAVITTIPMDQGPENMSATPDGKFLYVANIRSNDVWVINTATNTVLTTITVGLYPINISASADGKSVYVSNYNDNSMSVISTATNTVTSIVSGFNAPTAVSNSLAAGASCAGDPITFTIKVNVPVPVIIATGTLTALTTIYGTPSASTSFTVSAANMTSGVLVTPPAGFEVSTDNIHFFSTVTVGAAGTIASTPVYVRLAATTPVGNYSGDVMLTSAGATAVHVPTVNSTVTPAPLTITANNVDKTYGTTLTSGSGSTAFTATGLQNSDIISGVTIAYGTGSAATDGVGTYPGSVTASIPTGATFTASNYNITYIPGDIIVSPVALTITANNVNKPYGTGITGGSGSTAFTVTGLQNSETIGSVTIAYGPGSAATDGVGTYTASVTASAAAGGTFSASNYNITYVPGDIIVSPVALIITANTVNKPYGTAITGGSGSTAFTVTGLQNSETIGNVTIAYGAGSAAGDAPQTYIGSVIPSAATGGTFTTGNYIITYIPGDIIIDALPAFITTTPISGIITACVGTASATPNVQQFTVWGSNLTGDITATAPAGFEVSLTAAAGFGGGLTLGQSGGAVNQVVYVRSASTASVGLISGDITLASVGAPSKSVTVKGAIDALPTVNAVTSQTLQNGASTAAVNFKGTGNTFTWTNDKPGIGLAAGGTGDITSFTAVNMGSIPVTATIAVTPLSIGYAYIANSGSNSVSVINTTNNELVTTIPVGRHPFGVSVSPDGTRAYVTNTIDDNFSVINTATNTVIETRSEGGSSLNGIWVSPDGSRIVVANGSANTISILNSQSTSPTPIAVGKAPFGLAGSPNGTVVYVANSGSNNVTVINTLSSSVTATISVGANPLGVAVSPDGKLVYITNGASNTVSVISAASNTVTTTIPVGTNPYAIAVNPDGSLVYVSNYGSNTVSVINTATNAVSATINVGSTPDGLSLNPDGSVLYVTNEGSNTLSVISTATNMVINTISTDASPSSFGNFIRAGTGCSGTPVTFTITVNPAATQPPSLLASPATGNITACAGTASASPKVQQFSVDGAGLTADVIALAPADFEVSLSATSGFGASVTLPPLGGAINDVKVYVRSSALAAAGKISGKISLSTAGLPDQKVPVSGVINSLPAVNAVASQTVVTGTQTNPVNFSGTGNSFTWANDNPTIGLVSGGTGDIPAFTAVNTGTSPGNANVTVTPSSVGYAYIANSTSGNVSVINTQTNAVVTTITVGQTPTGVAVSPDGSLVYVANQSSGGVSVISAKLNALLATILTTGNSPTALTVSPDGTRLYVVNLNSNDLSVINTSTYSLITTIPVGGYPNGVAVSPDGSRVYVANSTNSITVIDATLNTVKTTILVGKGPYGLTVSPNGLTLYVAISGANSVAVINTATNTVTTTIPVGQNPLGVAMSPDGSLLYVSNQFAKTISVISTATNAIATTIPAGANPSGISVSADGSLLYVANYNDNTVSAINTATNTVISTIAVGSNPLSLGNFMVGGNGCSGTPITFTITVNPNKAIITASGTLTGVTTVYGTPSPSTSFNVSGTDLTAGISIVAPTGFELSTDNVTFAGPVTVSAPGTVTDVPVYIRLAATTPVGIYSGNITLSSQGAVDVILAMPNSTVTPAPLTITANNINKNYGTAITSSAGSTGFTSTGLKNSENIGSVTLAYSAGAAATDGAGTYKGSVTASTAIGGSFTPGNYSITYLPGDLIVVPLPLTIIADDKTKIYGDPNPVLTVAYIGFINSDGPDILLTQPVITTTAGTTSPAGQYPITASGATAANYTITFLPGTLTVELTPQALVIPNTFTPNGDGINDTWNIKNLVFFPNCDVEIFNRYGQKVFSSIGYGISWDGTYNNARLPTGTYYYIIDLKNEGKALSGFVAIVR